MRIISFQDKSIFLLLKHNYTKMYENVDYITFQARYNDLYNKVRATMIEKLNIPHDRFFIPIWGWVVRKDFEFTKDNLDELVDRMRPKCNTCVALDMEIANTYTLLMNFDVWEDILFKINFEKDYDFNKDFYKLFEKQKGARLQVAIPFIHKDFIKSFMDFSETANKDYSKVEDDIQDKIRRGAIITDETGDFIEEELE